MENVVAIDDADRYEKERVDLACALRWCARLNMHEGVANHFSVRVEDPIGEGGAKFLLNPKNRHFARATASELLLLDANDRSCLSGANPPEPTAWGLHSAFHRNLPHARCVLHAHPVYSTVLASLADSSLPPIDQNTTLFFNRYVIDEEYGGLAFESEGERCSKLMQDRSKFVMIMGNHGVLTIGDTVAQAFDRLYYFERAAQTYIHALQTGRPMRVLSDEIAAKTAQQEENIAASQAHFDELMRILREEEPEFMA